MIRERGGEDILAVNNPYVHDIREESFWGRFLKDMEIPEGSATREHNN